MATLPVRRGALNGFHTPTGGVRWQGKWHRHPRNESLIRFRSSNRHSVPASQGGRSHRTHFVHREKWRPGAGTGAPKSESESEHVIGVRFGSGLASFGEG